MPWWRTSTIQTNFWRSHSMHVMTTERHSPYTLKMFQPPNHNEPTNESFEHNNQTKKCPGKQATVQANHQLNIILQGSNHKQVLHRQWEGKKLQWLISSSNELQANCSNSRKWSSRNRVSKYVFKNGFRETNQEKHGSIGFRDEKVFFLKIPWSYLNANTKALIPLTRFV